MGPNKLPDPSKVLPRDPTGSYLHLKLKRFANIQDLSMPYARTTWQQYPHDVAVSLAPNARAMCRQCHAKIGKNELRYQLLLQCHKGCKNAAYFHADCVWKYPETSKITNLDEFFGLDDLPQLIKATVEKDFSTFVTSHLVDDNAGTDSATVTKKRAKTKASGDSVTSTPVKKKGKVRSSSIDGK
ncbi:polyADP-ribose polymerase and DNA-ligase Zn-finger region-containing protein [Nitzschia inconspicua]|uniref:PolyADP-ribose polymerase and DNA-ligase Zn-finger region-containing protein n=1 Tax=Nitzschia inconspicua TaxID=303405 RepID=A0A9K3L903_9STRA|nr:polyADP-ribose polymerase and DNA-ligase Zn-finger region-containing protein [Nitzschia inconspicua]